MAKVTVHPGYTYTPTMAPKVKLRRILGQLRTSLRNQRTTSAAPVYVITQIQV